jgi:poly-gamma-glutamate capsule biosynthesis protein CapA/YwtB (metallophosphatase superfamily)
MIAFTDNEPDWEATPERPGTCYVPVNLDDPRARQLLQFVTDIRPQTDCLIVSCHWGPNWDYRPPNSHIVFGHALVDAGADVVYGHSAHVFRGIEVYRGRPILYSTGDFIDDYAVDEIERNDESFIFVLDFLDGAVREISLYPTIISLNFGRAGLIRKKRAGYPRKCNAFAINSERPARGVRCRTAL